MSMRLAGATEILAETFSEVSTYRNWIRHFTQRTGKLKTKLRPKAEALTKKKFIKQFYDTEISVRHISATRTLAINRGEKAKILSVKIVVDERAVEKHFHFRLIGHHKENEATAFVENAYREAYKRFIGPAIERELRNELTDQANAQSIDVFGQNLYNLLMQAPVKGKVVLGFDPAYRTGCKLAVVDENGKFLAKAVIYPHKPAPQAKRNAAAGEFRDLLRKISGDDDRHRQWHCQSGIRTIRGLGVA
jgi:uncharacterized protein